MKNNEKRKQVTYTEEQKEMLLKRLYPPESMTITRLAKETGVGKSTLSTWRSKAIQAGEDKSRNIKAEKSLSAREKFLIVMETYSMPEIKLSEYCRAKGLYVEHVKKWRETCIAANGQEHEISKDLRVELQGDKKKIKILEKELNRKEKALAEAAALLVLRKKLGAIFGDTEEE